jgi:hypothetical protein
MKSSFSIKFPGWITMFYFFYPTIKEDSKKLKTMKVSALVLKKS